MKTSHESQSNSHTKLLFWSHYRPVHTLGGTRGVTRGEERGEGVDGTLLSDGHLLDIS